MHLSRAFRTAGRTFASFFLLAATFTLTPFAAHAASPLGELKTAVLLVNFQGNTAQPLTVAGANSLVFGQVSDFFWEASYQKTFLSGAAHGWFTLPLTNAACDTPAIAREANAAAAAAGVDLSGYSQVIYMFPYVSACSWSGANDRGDRGEERVFMNGSVSPKVLAHELGHRYSLPHSDAFECGAVVLGPECYRNGYGDQADTMGARFAHFNAYHKERLGWLGATGTPRINTVTASGRYTIEPFETATAGVKALKLFKGNDPVTGKAVWFYVEYRQPLGVDANLLSSEGSNMTKGILIRIGTMSFTDYPISALLDMTPNSNTGIYDVVDGALEPGRSFVDADSGVTISLVSADVNGAMVDVSIAKETTQSCTRAAPALAISGPTTAVAAGAQLSYVVTLTNRDTSACSATSFSLAASVPVGWSSALGNAVVSLSAGASANTTLTVVSPSTTSAGSYGVGVGVSSGVGAIHTESAFTTYSVSVPVASSLTGAVGTDKASYLRSETVAMSALVRNVGIPVSGAGVRFTVVLPNGSTAVSSAVTGSDGFARSSYRIGKGKTAVGTYQLRADASSVGATATAVTNFGVR